MSDRKCDSTTFTSHGILTFLLAVMILLPTQPLAAVETDDVLARRFAPNLLFATGELFYPTSVMYHLENSDLKRDGRLVDSKPTPESIAAFTDTRELLPRKSSDQFRPDRFGFRPSKEAVRDACLCPSRPR